MKRKVYAVASQDYDSLLFGAPILVRNINITGKRKLPGKTFYVEVKPEVIELEKNLKRLGINREQLIDIALLVGTDYNEGVKGIGPKKALSLIRKYGELEKLPESIRRKVPPDYEDIRRIFLEPNVDPDYVVNCGTLNEEKLYDFLCDEREFSVERVKMVIERVKKCHLRMKQTDLEVWLSRSRRI